MLSDCSACILFHSEFPTQRHVIAFSNMLLLLYVRGIRVKWHLAEELSLVYMFHWKTEIWKYSNWNSTVTQRQYGTKVLWGQPKSTVSNIRIISDERMVQQTKWYHSSMVLRKVNRQKPLCYITKAIPDDLQQPMSYNSNMHHNSPHGLQSHTVYNAHTYYKPPRYTVYNLNWKQSRHG